MFGLLSKLLASHVKNYFPKRSLGTLLHTLSKLNDVPVGFVGNRHLRRGVPLFVVTKRWLLLDIG